MKPWASITNTFSISPSPLTTHPPTLFLTKYFLTNFNYVEHPPYLLNFWQKQSKKTTFYVNKISENIFKKAIILLNFIKKLALTTHPPSLFLTNNFLTSFNEVEHPPYLLTFWQKHSKKTTFYHFLCMKCHTTSKISRILIIKNFFAPTLCQK